MADYGTDPRRIIADAETAVLIDDAARFVARITELLADPPSPERG